MVRPDLDATHDRLTLAARPDETSDPVTAMPTGSTVAWIPEDLPINPAEIGGWSYVVLEEIVDDVALLRRWPWPVVDPLGRLLWPDGAEHDSDAATVDLDLMKAQLYRPNRIEREPRCGDTFAASRSISQRWPTRRTQDLRDLLGQTTIYDISADAREAAKIAYQSSLGAIQPTADDDARTAVEQILTLRASARLEPLELSPPPSLEPR